MLDPFFLALTTANCNMNIGLGKGMAAVCYAVLRSAMDPASPAKPPPLCLVTGRQAGQRISDRGNRCPGPARPTAPEPNDDGVVAPRC